jgi:small subunit ribosomal protein S17e
MGKIKTKLIKRTSNTLLSKGVPFKEDFEANKRVLGKEMPSKKVRNQIAGYLSRLKTNQRKIQEKIDKSIEATRTTKELSRQ